MNMETIIIGTIVGLIYLPIVTIWACQTFALKRDLNRVETRLDQIQNALQMVARDNERAIGKVEGKLDMLLRDHDKLSSKS
jgi:uncharacterized membrane-anchored protein YhcB (DUF1043 family)